MSDAVRQELHELATKYATGELHQSTYRARRAQLLDALVGLRPLSETQESTRPRIIVSASTSGSVRALADGSEPTRPHVPAPSAPPAASGGRGPWIALAALVLLGLGGAFWWQSRAPKVATVPSSVAAGPNAGAAPAIADPAALVADFLAREDWSDGAVSKFNASWWGLSDTLSGAQVATILTAPGTQALRSAVAAQLRERASLDPSAPIVLLAHNLNVEIPAGTVDAYAPAPTAAPTTGTPAAEKPATAETSGPPRATAAATPAPTAPGARIAARPTDTAPAAPAPPRPAAAIPAGGAATPTVASATAPSPPATADPCRSARRGLCHDTLPGGVEGPKLVLIAAGSFAMGSTAHPEEQPVHQVTIAKPFAVTISEISYGEYRAYCTQPGHECPKQPWDGEKRPVVNVSWSDAADYATWLSQVTGQHYRLPTEAEWEYFARAGTTGDYWSNKPLDLSQAYFASAAAAPEAPAELSQGGFNANPWGLLHVAGNVREWVADAWSPNYDAAPSDGSARTAAGGQRVVRGGSYHDPLPKLRSAARDKLDPQTHDPYTGFRLVRELAP